MATRPPIFKSAFVSEDDEFSAQGIRPVVFDILAPDLVTSILPEGTRMVLHVNPSSMAFSYAKQIERIQTKGGFVEQHWGEAARSITFAMATGGFKRLYSGLSNVTGGGHDTDGTRRETIAYDKYLDLLALFHNNGSIYDTSGQIALQGIIKVLFDGGVYLGWFTDFGVTEAADKPFQFALTATFTVAHEIMRLRSPMPASGTVGGPLREPGASPPSPSAVVPMQPMTQEDQIRALVDKYTEGLPPGDYVPARSSGDIPFKRGRD